jgi:hypothetical protein
VELSGFKKLFQLFLDGAAALADFFISIKMLFNVSFINKGHQKSVFVSTNSHNFKISKEIHS